MADVTPSSPSDSLPPLQPPPATPLCRSGCRDHWLAASAASAKVDAANKQRA